MRTKGTQPSVKAELNNEALNEVMSKPPFWLVRSGNTLFFLTILLVLGLSYLIMYPDEITGKVSVLREKPVIMIQNPTSGELSSLLVRDKQWVRKGTLLAVFLNEKNQAIRWIAPVEGRILLENCLNIGAFYRGRQINIGVDPEEGNFQAVMRISGSELTRIKKGQAVFIELSDYPKNEFGILEGRIRSTASLMKKKQYEVCIELPGQLCTSYKRYIPEKAFMDGNARIIINNKRLFHRLFENLIESF